MKKILSVILALHMSVSLSAQTALAPAGLIDTYQDFSLTHGNVPHEFYYMLNMPSEKTSEEWADYGLLTERFPNVRFCPKRKRWVCDNTDTFVTDKKITITGPSERKLTWVNKAVDALDKKTREILLRDQGTRLFFMNDYRNFTGKESDYIDDIDHYKGFCMSFPFFFLDESYLDDPLELSNALIELCRKRSYLLEQTSREEIGLINSPASLSTAQEKKIEQMKKKHADLCHDEKITFQIKRTKTRINSLYRKHPLPQDVRQELLARTIRRYHEKKTGKKSKNTICAFETITDVLLDHNESGHKEALRIFKTHENDIINMVKLFPDDPNRMIAGMDLISAYRKSYPEELYSAYIRTFFLSDLIRLISDQESLPEVLSSGLRFFRYCSQLVSTKEQRRLEDELLPVIKKIINTSKDRYLKTDAIMALWAAVNHLKPYKKSRFFKLLKEKASLFEKYVLKTGEPCLEKAGLLALELLWKKIQQYPEQYNRLLTRYIFKEDTVKKASLRRGRVYGADALAKGIIPGRLPTLVKILNNDAYLKHLITVLTVLRIAYPHSMLADDPSCPLEWVAAHGAYKINEMFFTPVSESFRRFIFFDMRKDILLELKIPGERESSNTITRKHYLVAKKRRSLHPENDPEVVKPEFFMPVQGTFDTYEPHYPPFDYSKSNPFGIAAYEYRDRKRLYPLIANVVQWGNFIARIKHSNFPDLSLTAVGEKIFIRICADVFLHILRMHHAGYANTKPKNAHDSITDCHLGNFALYKNGRVPDITDYGAASRDKKLLKKYRDNETISLAEDLFSSLDFVIDVDTSKQNIFTEVLDTVIADSMRVIPRKKDRRAMLDFIQTEFKPVMKEINITRDIFDTVIKVWSIYIENSLDTLENSAEIRSSLISYYTRERAVERAADSSKYIFQYKYESLQLINNVLASDTEVFRRRFGALNRFLSDKAFADIFTGDDPPSLMFLINLHKIYWEDMMGKEHIENYAHIAHYRHDENQYIFDFSILDKPDEFLDLFFKEIKKRRMLAESPAGKKLAQLSAGDMYNPLKMDHVLRMIGITAAQLKASM